ncbi:MAG: GGDEF domain-containing protein [Aminipila sp.]
MKKRIMGKKGRVNWKRVDVQVSFLTAVIVTVACLCIYIFGYTLTYNDMIYNLRIRVESISDYLNEELDKSTFININNREDMQDESYIKMKELFSSIKTTTGVQYLYTAKKNEQGELVYVIDGLSEQAEDFRAPGDSIESEISNDLKKALEGEAVLPNKIVKTSWGDIFVTYLPVYEGDKVIGAIGIEFRAEHQYRTYYILRVMAPITIILACVFGALMSLVMFRRISNPHYQDLANTDYLTGLKNRNAYEVDIRNICAIESVKNLGIIIADLNGLKFVNDSLGHDRGDDYIKYFAKALRVSQTSEEIIYRMGGDEFIILIENATDEILEGFIKKVESNFRVDKDGSIPEASCSFGKAICKGDSLLDFEAAYKIADKDMYNNKKIKN